VWQATQLPRLAVVITLMPFWGSPGAPVSEASILPSLNATSVGNVSGKAGDARAMVIAAARQS
jgi:hypothetical protein